ncbi:hypothetical protein G7Y89_g6240 [Cudoniella acicularis]|uniref:Uncharacterized protein n=1 Tax=Cudoniella acicularis TaxID=354080 RepID=A0A8H4W2M2_9HELO|nr:hypothetical protein G7Y89_g6240 [Cudoniella acicularis]
MRAVKSGTLVEETRPTKVNFLILGAGWTSTFLIPLLEKEKLTYAATTTTGRDGTYKFKFEHDSKNEDAGQYAVLPEAETVLITFPLKGKNESTHLVTSYTKNHESASKTKFIQLGSTGIWTTPGQDCWVTRHSKYDKLNSRAIAEDELLSLGGCVLNLSGLWGGARQPKHWIDRIASTKEQLKSKTSLHMIHGLDVARAIIAVHRNFNHAAKQRWMLTDLMVYDWWALILGFAGQLDEENSNSVRENSQIKWVGELMNEENHELPLCSLARNNYHYSNTPQRSILETPTSSTVSFDSSIRLGPFQHHLHRLRFFVMEFSFLNCLALFLTLFSTSILGIPHGLARRQVSRLQNDGLELLQAKDIDDLPSPISFSSNWAGAILNPPPTPSGQVYNFVSGQFTIPLPSLSLEAPGGFYSAAIWVGIGGTSKSSNPILQAGVNANVQKTAGKNQVFYEAWYEWFPLGGVFIPSFESGLKAGDVISVEIKTSSSTNGTIVLSNLSTGQEFALELIAPDTETYRLGGLSAEWIVEDYGVNTKQVSFVDFGKVRFSNCVAKTQQSSFDLTDAVRVEMHGKANSTLVDASTVEVNYAGQV